MQYVPVVDKNNKPLMPCHPARARILLKKGRAIYFWKIGIFCIKLLDRVGGVIQPIAVGIDPGSKREGISVKSEFHTYLNILLSSVDWVKSKIESRSMYRRSRRQRKTPYRQCRSNRANKKLSPSTYARWNLKIRVLNILKIIYPITDIIVEDVKAITKKFQKKWNKSFSPLEVGKNWFYDKIKKIINVEPILKMGYETKKLRDDANLKKISNKLKVDFYAHNVDSWVLANFYVGGHIKPDNIKLLVLNPLNTNKRQLHDANPKNGIRKSKNTKAMLLKNTLVEFKNQLCLICGIGVGNNSVSLKDMRNKRVNRSIIIKNLKVLDKYNKWGFYYA